MEVCFFLLFESKIAMRFYSSSFTIMYMMNRSTVYCSIYYPVNRRCKMLSFKVKKINTFCLIKTCFTSNKKQLAVIVKINSFVFLEVNPPAKRNVQIGLSFY